MPASETIEETWKRVVVFVTVVMVLIAIIYSFWIYSSYSRQALELREARVEAQRVLSSWSGTGNMSGVIRLEEVNESALEPGTTVTIYYANGSLAMNVSHPP
jgi:hypothetical protein